MSPISQALDKRILVMDGAMATLLRSLGYAEPDYFLVQKRPEVIADIHRQYAKAGADIIRTATFSANIIDANYGTDVRALNHKACRIAKEVAREFDTPKWVAGSIGPTRFPLSKRGSFDSVKVAYREQMEALAECHPDSLIVETIYDYENARAAVEAYHEAGLSELPVVFSMTPTSGSLVTKIKEIDNVASFCLGLNCGTSPSLLATYLTSLQDSCAPIFFFPSCGLPQSDGRYQMTPTEFALAIEPAMQSGMVNVVGGCCGTTPAHIAKLAETAQKYKPRKLPVNRL